MFYFGELRLTEEGEGRSMRGFFTLVAALALAVSFAQGAAADPVGGHNATPGTLTCGNVTYRTTSGSPAALAIQLLDSNQVFVVKSVPAFGINHGAGIPSGKLITCTLNEPAIGFPVEIIGLLVPGS